MSRYAFELKKGLEKRGITTHTINSIDIKHSPIKSCFDYVFYLPISSLLSNPKSDIYHITLNQTGLTADLLKRFTEKKVITTIHDINPLLFTQKPYNVFLDSAVRLSVERSDLLIANSSQTKKDVVERYGIDENKIHVIPLGVDGRYAHLDIQKDDVFTVGYIGGFTESKDVQYLIRAYSIFEKTSKLRSRLLLYGKGPEIESCKKLAEELKIKSVKFMGFAPEEKLLEVYNSFDVFVYPTNYEGFGLPILEAQKCGIPVIVKYHAHIPEDIVKYCLRSKDETDMAEDIKKVSSRSFSYSSDHERYLSKFNWDKCVDATVSIYQKLLR
jgi:glycosyltransferase involved in cell wall biosynthesis